MRRAEFDLALAHVLEDTAPTEPAWTQALLCFREVVRTGHAAETVKLDETNAGERWRPLREALHALAVGDPRGLLRVAPEVRQPAEELMRTLTAVDIEPDADGASPTHTLVADAALRGASVVADAPTRQWPGTARGAGKRRTSQPAPAWQCRRRARCDVCDADTHRCDAGGVCGGADDGALADRLPRARHAGAGPRRR